MVRAALLALLTVTNLTGCLETSYRGRDPRKAYVTMQNGQHGYTRNGEFHNDVFGGGLVEVVRGNPAAMEAANTFHDRMIGGFLATVVGAACIPALLAYDLSRNGQAPGAGSPSESTYLYAALGCSLVMIGGAAAMITAVPYQMDAINLYNDGVDGLDGWQAPRFPTAPPAQPPASGAPGAD